MTGILTRGVSVSEPLPLTADTLINDNYLIGVFDDSI